MKLSKEIKPSYIVFIVLVFFWSLCLLSVLNKYLTVDESVYIVAGYSYLKELDFRMNQEHPIFAKLLYGIPLLFINPKLPTKSENWERMGQRIDVGASYNFAADFYNENKDEFRAIVLSARVVVITLAALLAFFVFRWTYELFGFRAAMLALLIFCFEPNIIAHARLATLDMPLTFFVFVSFYFFWKFAQSSKQIFLWVSAIALSLAILTKYTALLFFPLLFLFALSQYKALRIAQPSFFKKHSELLHYAFIFLVFLFIPIVIANLLYAFESYKPNYYLFIPARMLEGFDFISRWVSAGREGYLLGEFHTFMPEYFLIAFLIKSTLPFLILLALSIYFFLKNRNKEAFSILMPALLFFILVSLFSRFYLGLRYILPAYPFLCVFISGSLASELEDANKRKLSIAIVALLVWHIYSSLSIFPHYLAYFNELVGGPANGPKYLSDSNIDWGQDLFYFIEFARENDLDNPNFIYFGWPYATMFLQARYEPICKPTNTKIAVSVTRIIGLTKDDNCLRWLLNYESKARIGWSIYYYEIE